MKKTKAVFKGKLLKVFVKQVRLPHGYVATYEMIKHPGASLVVPFLAKDKIIMLRQLRPVIGAYIYELPAGTLDKNEAPIACARREIIEETGYSAAKFTLIGKIYPVPGYSTEKIFIYKASGLKKIIHSSRAHLSVPYQRQRYGEEDEVIENRILTRAQTVRLFKTGRITDAKTIAALAFCGWL